MSLMNLKGNLSRPGARGEATGYAVDLVEATSLLSTEPTRYGLLDPKARSQQGRGQVGAAKGTGQVGAASGQRTCRRIASSVRCWSAGTHVTCFTGTKVQILTQKALVGKSGSWHVRMMMSVFGWMLVEQVATVGGCPLHRQGRVTRLACSLTLTELCWF